MRNIEIIHHGAVTGVTGSCHQLNANAKEAILIDCGLFQGDEAKADLSIQFELTHIKALVVTHCHIDHVGRIPYLLAAGFKQPIYATEATAKLLPLVIEDALKIGVTKDEKIIKGCLKLLASLLKPIPYQEWFVISEHIKAKFQVAGHILGSAYVECEVKSANEKTRVVFSGDLGAPYTPLLPAPKAPYKADVLVIESTYGDHLHQGRKQRAQQLQKVIEKAVADNGVVLIPAFSIGRTQELLYELENIIFKQSNKTTAKAQMWQNIEVIIDSPMAAKFTQEYRAYTALWDKEAKRTIRKGRHPLNFESLYTVNTHQEHQQVVNYLASRRKPAIVIAAGGMCAGGRIINYLKRFLTEKTADVLFVGYQAKGTPGRDIQKYGPKGGYVYLDNEKIAIKADIHTISGYSAHADQKDLINFVKRMRYKPELIKIVHGDGDAKAALKARLERYCSNVIIASMGGNPLSN